MAQRVEDLKVWQRARDFCVAVNANIGRPGFQRALAPLDATSLGPTTPTDD